MKYSYFFLLISLILTFISFNNHAKVVAAPIEIRYFNYYSNNILEALSSKLLPGVPIELIKVIVGDIFNESPDPSETWKSILEFAEVSFNQKVNDLTYSLVESELMGFSELVSEHYYPLFTVPDITPDYKTSVYISIVTQIIRQEQLFKTAEYQTTLLPLFTQFANIYLAFIRDGIINAQDQTFPWSAGLKTRYETLLKSKITNYVAYAQNTGDNYINSLPWSDEDPASLANWNRLTQARTELYQSTLSFSHNWKYFDITRYPSGSTEIVATPYILLSELIGNVNAKDCNTPPFRTVMCKKLSKPGDIAAQAPTNLKLVQVTAYIATDDAFIGIESKFSDGSIKMVGYKTNSDPGSIRTSTVNIGNVPILSVIAVPTGDRIHSLRFKFGDGKIKALGSSSEQINQKTIEYPGQCLVNILDSGVTKYDDYLAGITLAFNDVDIIYPSYPLTINQYYSPLESGETRYDYITEREQVFNGWNYAGPSFNAFSVKWSIISNPDTSGDLVTIYRYTFNQRNGLRVFFSTDKDYKSEGWVSEGPVYQAYKSNNAASSLIPVYRYSRDAITSYGGGKTYGLSTVSTMSGWENEGVLCYTTPVDPLFLSKLDMEYKLIQNVDSGKCLTSPTEASTSIILSTCDQSNLNQFWYFKYDQYGPHLYNPVSGLYINKQSTTPVATLYYPLKNYNVFNKLNQGQYSIQEYVSGLCLEYNDTSGNVEYDYCSSTNSKQVWKYPSSILVENSKSIPIFPGACLDSKGLKCPSVLLDGSELKTSTISLTFNSGVLSLNSVQNSGDVLWKLGTTQSTYKGPYTVSFQSDGNIGLYGNGVLLASGDCQGLGAQYLNLLDNSLYGLNYAMMVQNNANKMVWSKNGYPISYKIGLIPGSYIDNDDPDNYRLSLNRFITNGRDYLTIQVTNGGVAVYLYGSNPTTASPSSALWKTAVMNPNTQLFIHHDGNTNTFCYVDTYLDEYGCKISGDQSTPSIESSRYLQIPPPGSSEASDWAIALRSATGSLTYGIFGNSKVYHNYITEPSTSNDLGNRFLRMITTSSEFKLVNVITGQTIQKSTDGMILCSKSWTPDHKYQIRYDTTSSCSQNAELIFNAGDTYLSPTTQSLIFIPSMPEIVVTLPDGSYDWSQGYSTF